MQSGSFQASSATSFVTVGAGLPAIGCVAVVESVYAQRQTERGYRVYDCFAADRRKASSYKHARLTSQATGVFVNHWFAPVERKPQAVFDDDFQPVEDKGRGVNDYPPVRSTALPSLTQNNVAPATAAGIISTFTPGIINAR